MHMVTSHSLTPVTYCLQLGTEGIASQSKVGEGWAQSKVAKLVCFTHQVAVWRKEER